MIPACINLSKISILLLLIFLAIILPAKAEVIDSKTFFVEIPKAIKLEGVGISKQEQTHGLPSDVTAEFNLLVSESSDTNSWELTTSAPVGISISYNSGGTIMAVFASMHNLADGYVIPSSDINVYPSKVIFDTGPKGGDSQRIFHFNPIIRVSKNTPPGNYLGTITFTILGQ